MVGVVLGLVRWLGRVVYALGGAGFVIHHSHGRPRILLYHACEREESEFVQGLRSNTPPEAFARQLDFLTKHYSVTDLETAVSTERPAAAAAITFDDGYRSVYRNAFPALVERDLPARVFLISDAIGDGSTVWVNTLNRLIQSSSVAREFAARETGLDPAETMLSDLIETVPSRDVPELIEKMSAVAGIDPTDGAVEANLFLTAEQIEEMASKGVSFGNHTVTHPNLSRCDDEGARREVREADHALRAFPGFVGSFAFPFGYTSEAARNEAATLGYSCVMEVGGVNAPLEPTALARQPVQAETPAELFAQMELVEPFKAWVRRRMKQS